MNMCGLPHHAQKAIDAGIDIICAQGTEAGGVFTSSEIERVFILFIYLFSVFVCLFHVYSTTVVVFLYFS
jgi:hypothetical protein